MIIVLAEQLMFLETFLELWSRKRRFARCQSALGQRQEFGNRPVLSDISSLRKLATNLRRRSSEAISSRTSSSASPAVVAARRDSYVLTLGWCEA